MDRAGFHDVLFPEIAAVGATMDLVRKTDIVSLASGGEVRRGRWAGSRRRWDLSLPARSFSEAEAILAFFEARQGRRFAFRFRDPLGSSSAGYGENVSSSDQGLGTGDGVTTEFALTRTVGGQDVGVPLAVAGSVVVAIDGSETLTGWSLSATRDAILFDSPPPEGAVLTAGFHHDTPVRFDSDNLKTVIGSGGVRIEGLALIEVSL